MYVYIELCVCIYIYIYTHCKYIGSQVGLIGTDLAGMKHVEDFSHLSGRKKSTLRVDGIAAMDGTDHCYTQRS